MLKLLKRFRDDEGGAFLVLFGILAIVLVATSGAVVDYTSVEQARTRGQVALDAAALALQPIDLHPNRRADPAVCRRLAERTDRGFLNRGVG